MTRRPLCGRCWAIRCGLRWWGTPGYWVRWSCTGLDCWGGPGAPRPRRYGGLRHGHRPESVGATAGRRVGVVARHAAGPDGGRDLLLSVPPARDGARRDSDHGVLHPPRRRSPREGDGVGPRGRTRGHADRVRPFVLAAAWVAQGHRD